MRFVKNKDQHKSKAEYYKELRKKKRKDESSKAARKIIQAEKDRKELKRVFDEKRANFVKTVVLRKAK